MGLDGARVLVIGGGSGIGYAVAEAAVAEGAQIVVASTQAEKVRAAAQRLGEAAVGTELDVTDERAVATFFERQEAFDHIVTTAGDWGALRRTRLADLDLADAADVFRVRFWGALAVAKHGGARLPQGGSLTLTDGMIAHKPAKGSAASSAMAGAIEHLTRALAVELAPARVNCVCPGMIRTGAYEAAPPERQEAFDRSASRLLIPRLGWPKETAEAYLYLMRGGYTTGQVLFVEGGSTLS